MWKRVGALGPTSLLLDRCGKGFLSNAALPFVAHWAALVATCFTVLHVQVSTRFLSSSPALYWFVAVSLTPAAEDPEKHGWRARWLCAWLLGFGVGGTALFCSFYPWT